MKAPLHQVFNSGVDRLVRPVFRGFRRSWSAFKVCGYTGLVLAYVLAMTLVVRLGLSPWVMVGLGLSSMATFLTLAMITKIIVGEERLIYYHHEIAIMVVAALVLWLFNQPILPYLDLTLMGVGLFLACGRVGCLMVGCCHGRPHRWGVCYRTDHAEAGFAPYYVGVRFFPIQAAESLVVFGLVTVGTWLIWHGYPPGEALAWYVITYDVERFLFEFARGDSTRPYFAGFSEAQWTSLLLMILVVWAEVAGILTFHPWHAVATALVVLVMIGVAIARRLRNIPKHRLLHPHHIKEVAVVIDRVAGLSTEATTRSEPPRKPGAVYLGQTSLGIQISAGTHRQAGRPVVHYTLSRQRGDLPETWARALAMLILRLRHPAASNQLTPGTHPGVFHMLVFV